MSDAFDEVAKQLGIKRESAIRTYSVSILAGLEQEKQTLSRALHLLTEMIRRESPSLLPTLKSQLEKFVVEDSDISQPAEVALAALQDAH